MVGAPSINQPSDLLQLLPNTSSMRPFLPNDYHVEAKLNSRIFKVNDPIPNIHANLSIHHQLESSSRFSERVEAQPSSRAFHESVPEMRFLSTFQAQCSDSQFALINPKSYNKHANMNIFKDKLYGFDKKLEQTAQDRRTELLGLSLQQ